MEMVALKHALKDGGPLERLCDHVPSSPQGDAAFIRFLDLHTRYADRAESGDRLQFSALLLSVDNVFRAGAPQQQPYEYGKGDGASSVDLFHESAQLAEELRLREKPAYRVAYRQAVVVRESCRAAIALGYDLRLRFVADPRPVDAPIYEYAAGVEGFGTIETVRLDEERQSILVWLASTYLYSMSGIALSATDGVPPSARIVAATREGDGGFMRVTYDTGVVSDWPCHRILAVCERRYLRSSAEAHPSSGREALGHHCRRLAPV
jgi:hypothetical protein